MYNGIGLRTVRGSGTNGYVQRNLSHVDAARTRQTLARSQRGERGGGFGGKAAGGATRAVANADILLHERKRRVEVALMELTLEMEERGCDEDEILDKVARERERLLAQVSRDAAAADARDAGASNNSSSHARQRRKEEENARMKDAFGIASDHVPGESFDPEMQERRRQERIAKREQERAEREAQRQARLKEREERQQEPERRGRDRSNPRLATAPRRSRSGDRRERRASRSRSAGRKERGDVSKQSRRASPPRARSRSRSRARRAPSRSRRSPEKSSRRERERRAARRSASSSSSSGSSSASSRSRSRSRGKRAKSRSRRDARSRSRSGSDSSRSASRTPPRRRQASERTPPPPKRDSPPRGGEKKKATVLDLSKPTAGVKVEAMAHADGRPAKAELAKPEPAHSQAPEAPVTAASGTVERPRADAPKKVRQTSRWSERKVPAAVAPPVAPMVEAPKVETPKVETPKVEAPKVESSKAESSKAEAPKVVAPKAAEAHSESQLESAPPPPPPELALGVALAFALAFGLAVFAFGVSLIVALALAAPQPELQPQSESARAPPPLTRLLPKQPEGGARRSEAGELPIARFLHPEPVAPLAARTHDAHTSQTAIDIHSNSTLKLA